MKIRGLILMLCITLSWIPSVAVTNGSADVLQGSEKAVMPMSDRIVWLYRVINQKIYKRLYNMALNEWIGEWEYVRDL